MAGTHTRSEYAPSPVVGTMMMGGGVALCWHWQQ